MATYKTLVKLSLTFNPFMDSVLVPETIPEGATVNIEKDRGNGWVQLSIVPGVPLGWIFNSCKVLDDDGHLVNSPCIEILSSE